MARTHQSYTEAKSAMQRTRPPRLHKSPQRVRSYHPQRRRFLSQRTVPAHFAGRGLHGGQVGPGGEEAQYPQPASEGVVQPRLGDQKDVQLPHQLRGRLQVHLQQTEVHVHQQAVLHVLHVPFPPQSGDSL